MAGCSFDRIFYFTVGSQYSYRQLQAWECLCRSEIPCSLVDSMSLFNNVRTALLPRRLHRQA